MWIWIFAPKVNDFGILIYVRTWILTLNVVKIQQFSSDVNFVTSKNHDFWRENSNMEFKKFSKSYFFSSKFKTKNEAFSVIFQHSDFSPFSPFYGAFFSVFRRRGDGVCGMFALGFVDLSDSVQMFRRHCRLSEQKIDSYSLAFSGRYHWNVSYSKVLFFSTPQ